MKFVVPSKALYTVTSGVGKVINSKNALTILNNFLFAIEDNKLTITGCDTENALTGTIEVLEVEGSGKFCIDARRLIELLKELPDQPLTIDVNDNTYETLIKYPGGDYNMVAISGDQYPEYKKEEDDQEPITFVCPSAQLLRGMEKTLFAVGSDDFHPQMMGVLLDVMPDNITFVATDTHKLVRYIDSTSQPGVTAKSIMPAKPASILKSLLPAEGNVNVTMSAKSATFEFNGYVFNCRFIKGNYPPYNRVIPRNNPYVLRVDRQRFLNAVRRVGVFVDPGFGLEKFKITNDLIFIKSSDANMQSAGNEKLDCEYSGSELIIGFSAPYMIEICNNISTDEIIMYLADPSRPGVICPSENPEGTDLLTILMPMNVTDF